MGSTPKRARKRAEPSGAASLPSLTAEALAGFALLPQPVLLLDAESLAIIEANPAAERFYGWGREELLAMSIPDISQAANDARYRFSGVSAYKDDFTQRNRGGETLHVEMEPVRANYDGREVLLCVAHDVTARYQLARELLAREAANREVIQNANDIIYTHDLNGRFISGNRAAFELLGHEQSDLPNMSIEDVVIPEQRGRVLAAMQEKALGLRGAHTYELDVLHKDGRRLTLEVSSRTIFEDGRPVAVQGVARDVTERRRVDAALRESELKFRAVAESAPCAVLIYQGTRFVYANAMASEMTGYSTQELLDLDGFWKLATPEFQEVVRDRGTRRMAGENVPARYEFSICTRSGEERWVDFTASPISFSGKPAAAAMIFDVTERKRSEYALVQSEQLFRSLIENSSDVIAILDTACIVRYESPSIENLTGFSPGEIVGRVGFDFVHPDDLAGARVAFEKALTSTDAPHVRLRILRKDGSYASIEAVTNPLRSGDSVSGLLVSFRDIGERVSAESALRASEEKYRQLFQRNLAGVYVSRVDGTFIECNDSFAHIYGYRDRQEVLSGTAFRLYESTEERQRFIAQLRKAGYFSNKESLGRRKDGSTVWLLETASLMRDAETGEEVLQGTLVDITERKLAEQALLETEGKFRAVADTATSAIYIHNNERFLYVNRASQTISGYSEHELLHEIGPFDVVHPADHDLVLSRAEARRKGGRLPDRYEFRMLTKSGETRWLDFSASVTQFEGEDAILGTAFDITERKRVETMQSAMYRIAETAVRVEDLQEFFRATHEIVGELMYAKNYFIALVDPVTENLAYPYFVDEIDKAPDASYFSGRGLTRYILKTGESLRVRDEEFQQLVDRGAVESVGAPSVDWMGAPLKSGSQTFGVIVVQSYLEHVTFHEQDLEVLNFMAQHLSSAVLRKRNADALRDSEQQYRQLVQSAIYGIFRSGTRDNFLAVNPAMVRLLGYDSAEQILALNLGSEVFADREERAAVFQALHESGKLEGVEARWRRSDGKLITVRLSGRAVRDSAGEVEAFEVIAEDVTERRHLEDQLRQSQKMEAIGRLAGGVAHDFNNLLTVIKGYSELMMEEIRPEDPLRMELDEIQKAADRAATLTRQLLAFSRQQVMAPKVVDLNAIVNNMDKLLRRLLGEDVQLSATFDPDLGRVKADPGQIEQVIMNLAVNARDAMPLGGKLSIETANVDFDDTYAREHIAAKSGSYVMIAVTDSGTGMPPEVRQRIFEPFFTTKELGKGTGLGLSTVYGIVKQSDGYIWVYSEIGVGTSFKVYLPRVDAPADVIPQRQLSSGAHRGTETVLLVEDEDGVRALVRQVLHKHGYTVLEARHGGEALLQCERHAGDIQLLLTDVVLEQMSGRELAERLSVLRPSMKVLFISGYTDDAIIAHGVLAPGTAFLQKPFTTDALARKIRQVLDTISISAKVP